MYHSGLSPDSGIRAEICTSHCTTDKRITKIKNNEQYKLPVGRKSSGCFYSHADLN